MAKKTPSFSYDKCVACGICDQACPVSVIEMDKLGIDRYNKAYPEIKREGCIGCGQCALNCPMDAIEMIDIENKI